MRVFFVVFFLLLFFFLLLLFFSQIRGGIHTGSIVTGVIGHRVPRFLVMGETAIVASKLESHSVPGKIHVSPTTHR